MSNNTLLGRLLDINGTLLIHFRLFLYHAYRIYRI